MQDLVLAVEKLGGLMAQSHYSSAPVAPGIVGFWLTVKLKSQGRRDAKKYSQLSDYTRTHALIVAQNRALAGQREVNQWLIKKSAPLQVGNSRSVVKLNVYESELSRLKAENVTGGRLKRLNQERIGLLQREILNTESQLESNTAQLGTLLLAAEQALGSWSNYYEQMAGIYTRARSNKLRHNVDSVSAEVPELESITLVDFEELKQAESTPAKRGAK